MTEAEEVAYLVRRFDEIAETPKPQAVKKRGIFFPAIFLLTLFIIIVIIVIYVRKNGMPSIKSPFKKKEVATKSNSEPAQIAPPAEKSSSTKSSSIKLPEL